MLYLFSCERKCQIRRRIDNDDAYLDWGEYIKMCLITPESVSVLFQVTLFWTIRAILFGRMAEKSLSKPLQTDIQAFLLTLLVGPPLTFVLLFVSFLPQHYFLYLFYDLWYYMLNKKSCQYFFAPSTKSKNTWRNSGLFIHRLIKTITCNTLPMNRDFFCDRLLSWERMLKRSDKFYIIIKIYYYEEFT